MSTIFSRSIQYEKHGNPAEVLTLKRITIDTTLESDEILIKWLASPINPLDINKIQGFYPMPIEFPMIGGSEGVGVIEKVGKNVSTLKPGDSVISWIGASIWTEYSKVDESSVMKIDSRIDLINAATLLINPPTAYVMLKEYVKLEPGDMVIQNSANSAVGRCVIQLANAFGHQTINLIRDRPNVHVLKNELKSLGADYVFTEEEFKTEGRKLQKSLQRPIKLALNGVGGKSSLIVSSALTPGGTLVTYGGMSKKAHEISTSSLVFKNITAVGIAITTWLMDGNNEEKVKRMFDEIQKLILEGKFKPPPVELSDFDNFSDAINKTLDGKHGKQMLLLHPDAKLRYKL